MKQTAPRLSASSAPGPARAARHAASSATASPTGSAALSTADAGLIQRYLDHVRFEKRLAARTVTLYGLDLQKLAGFAAQAGVALGGVQAHHVRAWVARMHAGGRSGRGIALILSGWRGFYAWLGREGHIAANPVQDVRAPRQPRPLPKALGVDEAMQLAGHASAGGGQDSGGELGAAWLQARDAAMIELLYGCGLRVGELTGLDVVATDAGLRAGRGWIDLPGGEVQVQGKGGKRRSLPLGPPAQAALRHWLALRGLALPAAPVAQAGQAAQASHGGQSGQSTHAAAEDAAAALALFIGQRGTRLTAQSIWQRLRRAGRQAGLATPVHPHMLRHSFASHLLQSSSDLRGVQEMLGHAHIATTQVYTRLDFQHLANTYDAAHPRAKRKA